MPRNPLPELSEALWTFQTANFVVGFWAEEEHIDPADSFQFADDIAFARSGEPAAWFAARVSVLLLDTEGEPAEELGVDYLGGCSYRSFEEFYRGHVGLGVASRRDGCRYGAYITDMVKQAVADARRTVKARRELYANLGLRQ